MKAQDLIDILSKDPEAEILMASDNNWRFTNISGADLFEQGKNVSSLVDNIISTDEMKEDGELLKSVFVLF